MALPAAYPTGGPGVEAIFAAEEEEVPAPPGRRDRALSRSLFFPFFKSLWLPLGFLFIPFGALVVVGASNAVNLTDGLDGLAAGCMTMVSLTFTILAYAVTRYDTSAYLGIPYVPGAAELTILCAAVAGAGLGFLWFNCHPAQVFMGDTGSLPLGGAMGIVSVILRQELLLFLVGGIFVAEALSVIIQVASFKLTGKRVFRIAPLHHHFEFLGLHEEKVTVRFWIVAAALAMATLATLKMR